MLLRFEFTLFSGKTNVGLNAKVGVVTGSVASGLNVAHEYSEEGREFFEIEASCQHDLAPHTIQKVIFNGYINPGLFHQYTKTISGDHRQP